MRVQVQVKLWYEIDFNPEMTKQQIINELQYCDTLADIYELEEVYDVYRPDEWFVNIKFQPEDSNNLWFDDVE